MRALCQRSVKALLAALPAVKFSSPLAAQAVGFFVWCYILKMLRVLVLIAFLLANSWQPAALARVGSLVVGLADVQHTQLHAQQVAHQHHHDGSYQVDSSLEAAQHVMLDHLISCAVVGSLYSTRIPLSGGAALSSFNESFLMRHALDGLFRPPRHLS